MKPTKKAQQMNAEVDTTRYTKYELAMLACQNEIFLTNIYRIDLKNVTALKVEVDEFGYYCNVAITKSGQAVYITLS